MFKKSIDYAHGNLEEIKKSEINRAKVLLQQLNQGDKLCSMWGRLIVKEFQFKGDLDKVKSKLMHWIGIVETFGISNADRKELMEKHMRAVNFFRAEDENVYKDKSVEATQEGNFMEAIKIAGMDNSRAKEIHDKKECLCYNNV